MFWFWFWSTIDTLMVVMDAAFWIAAMHLTKSRLWRVLITIFVALQLTAALSMMLDFDWIPRGPKAVYVAVLVWHYFVIVVFPGLLVARACLRIAQWVVRKPGTREKRAVLPASSSGLLARRDFLGTCLALAPPLFTIGATGVSLAQISNFRVRRFTLSIPALPPALDGTTIAHVSDIHVGRMTCGRVLRKMVNTTNALHADLVLLTGDLINYELSDLSEGISLVKEMQGRYGQWMIEGNHDLLENGSEFQRSVKASGIPLLLNESALATIRGFPVQFLGLRWMSGGDRVIALQMRELLKQHKPDAFPILLAHHPHAFDVAAAAGLPLTLCGHTHGGQLMLNRNHGVGSVMFRYWSGLYKKGRSQLIVSNGIGNWFPIRVNAPAEIVHITLRRAET